MPFPLGLWDFSLWLAVTALTLIISSALVSLHHSKTNLYIRNKRLRNIASAISILFLITVAIRIISLISPV
jgi:threonine/homoserine/homoserine lactone efflux protein